MDGPFEYLVPTFVEETVEDYAKEFQAQLKAYRNKIKTDNAFNPAIKFRVGYL